MDIRERVPGTTAAKGKMFWDVDQNAWNGLNRAQPRGVVVQRPLKITKDVTSVPSRFGGKGGHRY